RRMESTRNSTCPNVRRSGRLARRFSTAAELIIASRDVIIEAPMAEWPRHLLTLAHALYRNSDHYRAYSTQRLAGYGRACRCLLAAIPTAGPGRPQCGRVATSAGTRIRSRKVPVHSPNRDHARRRLVR